MRIISKAFIILVAQSLFLLLIVGYALAKCEDPDILTISIIPTEESIQEFIIYKPVIDYLSRTTGKKIEFYVPVSYSNVIDAMVGKWVNIAILGPYSYAKASSIDPDIRVFATYSKNAGYIQEAGPGYKSVLITRKGSRFTTIASLKNSSVDLIDPLSTSGSLVPQASFSRLVGLPLEVFFGKITYSGGHDLAALAVYEGVVDATFTATHRFDNAIERGMVKKEDFNYLWYSQVLPLDPICYRDSLCPELKKKIEKTFLTLHTEPSCAKFLETINASRFVKILPKDYDIIREFIKTENVKLRK